MIITVTKTLTELFEDLDNLLWLKENCKLRAHVEAKGELGRATDRTLATLSNIQIRINLTNRMILNYQ